MFPMCCANINTVLLCSLFRQDHRERTSAHIYYWYMANYRMILVLTLYRCTYCMYHCHLAVSHSTQINVFKKVYAPGGKKSHHRNAIFGAILVTNVICALALIQLIEWHKSMWHSSVNTYSESYTHFWLRRKSQNSVSSRVFGKSDRVHKKSDFPLGCN